MRRKTPQGCAMRAEKHVVVVELALIASANAISSTSSYVKHEWCMRRGDLITRELHEIML